jgi:hypothetical protein
MGGGRGGKEREGGEGGRGARGAGRGAHVRACVHAPFDLPPILPGVNQSCLTKDCA